MTTIHDPRHHAFALNHGGGGIPALGFGTLVSDSSKTRHATVAAIEAGFRHLDCAERYRNEAEVGAALKDLLVSGADLPRGPVRHHEAVEQQPPTGPGQARTASQPGQARAGVGRPLSGAHPVRLQPGDDQDPRHPHGAIVYDDGVTLKETWAAMEGLVDEGLSRAIGLSDIDVEGTREIIDGARIKPAVVEVESHPYHPQWGLHQLCQTEGIVLLAFAPLGHALQPRLLDDPLIVSTANRLRQNAGAGAARLGHPARQRGADVVGHACPHRRERGRHRASRRGRPADQRAGDAAPVQLRRRRRRTGIPRSASRQLT